MARTTIRTEDITASEVTTAKMATDPTDASNLASGSVPLARLGNVDTSGITANQDDIALLGFKVAANGSLAKYNLIDQTIDAFEDASGVDTSASTGEIRNAANYYSGIVAASTGNSVHTSTGAGTFTSPGGATSANILVVAGGAGGAGNDTGGEAAGGGGGGGVVHHATYTLVGGIEYDLTVGAGGTAGATAWPNRSGGTGGNSSFNDNGEGSQAKMTALGGGGGSASEGHDGGSGGAPGRAFTGAGEATQGDSGGGTGYGNDSAPGETSGYLAGGGGGAGGVGANGSGSTGGTGGAGRLFSDFTTWGVSGYFAGGGGGGGSSTGGTAGSGGGGAGGGGNAVGNPGVANTGGGAGGADDIYVGGVGGSGTVIIKWTVAEAAEDMTLISNATTAVDGAPTTGDLVVTYTDGAGTATVNTDIKAYISRNGSAYSSAVTLVSQGTTGGHTILTANGVDLSGITTGTSMRWKIETLNQSAAKETRIQAVSLGWS